MSEEQQDEAQRKRLTELILGEYDYTRPRRGEVREAVILSISDNDIVVDLGAKRDGIVPPKDLQRVDREYLASLRVGDRIPVAIMRDRGQVDGIPVSLSQGLQQEDWVRAEKLLETGEIVEGKVLDHNRGGILVSFGRLNGFVPNSHLGSLPSGLRYGQNQEAKENLVGMTLELAVIEVNQLRRRLVMSKRVADRRKRRDVLEEIEEGQELTGVVRNLVDFGAFVDIGGIDGLIHISELAWQHVDHPGDVLKVGEEVAVYVLSVDRERERIGLSRKRLLPDPWNEVTGPLEVGQVVEGGITSVAPFGVFVDLGKGVDGLVHTSEMAEAGVAQDELVAGARVSVQILEVDHAQHQIALRLLGMVRVDEPMAEGAPLEEATVAQPSAEDVTVSFEEPPQEDETSDALAGDDSSVDDVDASA